jgi:pyruvate dehydrogenase E1 component alpha subunit
MATIASSSAKSPAQFLVKPAPEPLRLLGPDGALAPGSEAPLDDDALLDALRLMLLSRAVDTKGFNLQRQGRFGTFSQVSGQEASVVGSALALDPARDWIVPQYRELPALVRHGYPLVNFIRYFMGDPAGGAIPSNVNMLPIQISIAAHLPHAVGLGWGLRLQKKDAVVLTYFGDGGSSEGDFHEACNLAGIVRAPVVFFLQNNGWAISTPRSKQSAGVTLAERAPSYGFPGVLVDGNDLFAVYAATAAAVARAREGEGPTLIESLTYRLGAHNTSDDPTRYRNESEIEQQRAGDPIARIERYLAARNRWDESRKAQLEAEAEATVERAIAEAAATPPHAGQLFDHVYAETPPRLSQQRAEKTRETR